MKINEIIKNINEIIEEAVKDKIFLVYLIITLTVVFLGLVLNLGKLEFMVLILVINISLVSYVVFSLLEDEKRKLKMGAILILNFFLSMIIGYLLFCTKPKFSLPLLWQRIGDSQSHIYLFCLLLIPILVVLLKILFKKGRALTGGIASGHVAYSVSVLILTMNAFQGKGYLYFLLLFTVGIVAYSRVKSLSTWSLGAKITLGSLVVSASLLVVLRSINMQIPIVLIIAQIVLVLLTIRGLNSKKTHCIPEIFWGSLIGALTFFILMLF